MIMDTLQVKPNDTEENPNINRLENHTDECNSKFNEVTDETDKLLKRSVFAIECNQIQSELNVKLIEYEYDNVVLVPRELLYRIIELTDMGIEISFED